MKLVPIGSGSGLGGILSGVFGFEHKFFEPSKPVLLRTLTSTPCKTFGIFWNYGLLPVIKLQKMFAFLTS